MFFGQIKTSVLVYFFKTLVHVGSKKVEGGVVLFCRHLKTAWEPDGSLLAKDPVLASSPRLTSLDTNRNRSTFWVLMGIESEKSERFFFLVPNEI